ncbi:MAG TPA: SpaA isopeptide-forming pilin-related protein [Acidimicrobiales bacterium]|nr:SpaA isopeptide-forming pilin-related protein [Acidimicrobiales bacterium]
MAALAFFAQEYQGSGFPGYSVNDTAAAIAQVAYASGGGLTPPVSQGPPALVAEIEAWMVTYAGPWTISLQMTPASGGTFDTNTNYDGTITVLSANGDGVGGLSLTAPPVGGPGEITNFVWTNGTTTNAAGQIFYEWNVSNPGPFSAPSINVIGDAVGTTPPTYGAPAGSGGQNMMISGASEGLGTGFSGSAINVVEYGTISVQKSGDDTAYYSIAGAQFQIKDGFGNVLDTLTTDASGNTPPSTQLEATVGGTQYGMHESVVPTGYQAAPDQVVTVYPNQNTVAAFTGAAGDHIVPAQLGAAKIDAETNQPLAGAVFSFSYSTANNGVYDESLGSCTTPASGVCLPPIANDGAAWLPGWYQITESGAPPGYWLNPATTTQTIYLAPGASTVASVTFGDLYLGSLTLTKSGNDTAYWAIAGAQFTVTGPAPSTVAVGVLTVDTNGSTNTLSGLVPGTYTVTESTVPAGYSPVAPFTVSVTAGHATTTTSAADAVVPGTIVVTKTDAQTGDPLAGAVFDVRYDSAGSGTYDTDLGQCTTNTSGTCSPPANDGTAYLPGNYEAIEVTAPPGYYLPTPAPVATFTLTPGGSASPSFTDHLLVPASFEKVATGNVNPLTVILAGAVIDVYAGTTPTGPVVATCTTDSSGACSTPPALISSEPYCWAETVAPPGLQAGATGCSTAQNDQGAQPITVTDPGEFVNLTLTKVDAANPDVPLSGAVFDLYRVDGGNGPDHPTPPGNAAAETGQTWVARSTTGTDGVASYPLQFPGYVYCFLEVTPPANYVADTTEHCTSGPVVGVTTTPAPAANVTVGDTEQTVSISARKFNAASPNTVIPGATYQLYVVGTGAPSGPPGGNMPAGIPIEPGDTWWEQGTTDLGGQLSFTVPAGYAYCWLETGAPLNYVLDPALRCTPVVTASSPATDTTVALPETLVMVDIYGRKFNSTDPNTVIPGATYELVGQGAPPPGWSLPANPANLPVPAGDWYYATGTTNAQGMLGFSVPAGESWCFHELSAPPAYQLDSAWECTPVVTTATPAQAATIALPEQPVPPPALAFTGGPSALLVEGGGLLTGVGVLLLVVGRWRRPRPAELGKPAPGASHGEPR